MAQRYVIDLGDMPLEEAEQYTDLMHIVRKRVKPDRDRAPNNAHGRRLKANWWKFRERQPALRRGLKPLEQCIVCAVYTTHLAFAFRPTTGIAFNNKLSVFLLESWLAFSLLQSRIHECWAYLLSPRTGAANTLTYAPSKCFVTFPFPELADHKALEAAGEALYTARADYMIRHDQGLTDTYNQLKDPDCLDPEVEHLRRLHEAMDRAVLAAYGWDDIPVPPYGTADPDVQQAFEDEVIDRLFVLNAARAAEEQAAAAAAKPRRGAAKGKRSKGQPKDDQTLSLGLGGDADS